MMIDKMTAYIEEYRNQLGSLSMARGIIAHVIKQEYIHKDEPITRQVVCPECYKNAPNVLPCNCTVGKVTETLVRMSIMDGYTPVTIAKLGDLSGMEWRRV